MYSYAAMLRLIMVAGGGGGGGRHLETGDYPREIHIRKCFSSPCFNTHAISRKLLKLKQHTTGQVQTSLKNLS